MNTPFNLLNSITDSLDDSLLKPKYRGKTSSKTEGHCYVAAEALWHLWGKENGYTPQVMRCDDGDTHWFLRKGDQIADPTQGQFDEIPDYTKGRACGFLTTQPSKRAQEVIRRVHER